MRTQHHFCEFHLLHSGLFIRLHFCVVINADAQKLLQPFTICQLFNNIVSTAEMSWKGW
jgi:hypothetical protein